MMSALSNDMVRVIDQAGTTRGQTRAVVDTNSIITEDGYHVSESNRSL